MQFSNGNVNYGFDYKLNFILPKTNKFFISTGIRFNSASATISATNDGMNNTPVLYNMYWKHKWLQISTPLYIGKTFYLFKNNFQLNVYGGASIGYLATSNYESGSTSGVYSSNNNPIMVSSHSTIDEKSEGNNLLTSLDIGFDFTPIPKFPNLSLGVFLAHNLNKTNSIIGNSWVEDVFNQKQQKYYFDYNKRITNLTFTLTYSFGRK